MLTDRNLHYVTELFQQSFMDSTTDTVEEIPRDKIDLVVYDSRENRKHELDRLVLPFIHGNGCAQVLILADDDSVVRNANWLQGFGGLSRLAWFVISNPRGQTPIVDGKTLDNTKIHGLWYGSERANLVVPRFCEDTVMSSRRFPEAFAERVAPRATLFCQADFMDSFLYAFRERRIGEVYIYDPDEKKLSQLFNKLQKFNGLIL